MKKIAKSLIYTIIAVVLILSLTACFATGNQNNNDQTNSDNNSGGDKNPSADDHVHDYGEWGADTATCDLNGTQTKVCKTCGHEKTRKTPALGHDLVSFKDKAATCTEGGYTGYKECSRCDYSEGTATEKLTKS